MAVYVIGDVQGCFRDLKRLLDAISFDEDNDTLWFVGDLVNRGPDSLKTLRFVRTLGDRAVVVLGNHDLHLLAVYYVGEKIRNSDTLAQVLKAEDCAELMEWLRFRPLMHFDPDLNFALVHAGIYPGWGLSRALAFASEVESALRGDSIATFFSHMYGNEPSLWSEELNGYDRLRFLTNVFTRMRYLTPDKQLDLVAKGAPDKVKSSSAIPWFEHSQSAIKHNRVAFGHWSTLPPNQYGNCFALDSGCLWGGRLTALRIDKKSPRWFSLACGKKTRRARRSSR
jgi:bis(5'-nucleosyl)-tetraphosphatase (symmetrical)